MELQEAILHRIIKAERTTGANAVTVQPRSTGLPLDERLLRTAEDILHIYGKKINGYGTFDSNHVLYQFPKLLNEYVTNAGNFVTFSKNTTNLIAKEMAKAVFATSSYVLVLRYSNQGRDWLLVVMLKLKPGTGIDQETLTLEDTLSFDIDHLHEAARVDLEKWQNNTQPYLSFIKKNRGDEDVTLYFRHALGCCVYIDSKHHTSQVIKALDDFCQSQDWTPEQRNEARRRTYEYFDTNKEEVNLTALSATVFCEDPTAFSDYIREGDYEISETFKPHKDTYTKIYRIVDKFGSIRVSFDVEDIENHNIDYDSTRNCLIINNIPQSLIDKILDVQT